ncbi:hypothetical protein KUTeg_020356 [Tegillarca granosa]|uniref:Uncharacterized protein n=1 Tax=Tegillarca granosa TaxID=220873 RepID=A0ABQ9E7M1_TEGGR|nr:hypothetical protein KUTeg_020356 [Tegillarca granosa]
MVYIAYINHEKLFAKMSFPNFKHKTEKEASLVLVNCLDLMLTFIVFHLSNYFNFILDICLYKVENS